MVKNVVNVVRNVVNVVRNVVNVVRNVINMVKVVNFPTIFGVFQLLLVVMREALPPFSRTMKPVFFFGPLSHRFILTYYH